MKVAISITIFLVGAFLAGFLVILLEAGRLFADGNGVIVVTNPADSGPGTLRQALLDVVSGDTIVFDTAVFPPDIPLTIFILSPLPTLDDNNVTIDASEAGVILDGYYAIGAVNGFVIQADGCAIRGFIIQNFSESGIFIEAGAENNTIGGDRSQGNGPAGQGNTIGQNHRDGVSIWGDNNIVRGNYIGVEQTGQYDWGNTFSGVALFQGASSNTIGGTTSAERNVISGNDQNGIWIGQAGSNGNLVIGNYIGTTAAGMGPISNTLSGVAIQDGAQNNQIGNGVSGAGNLISGNGINGVYVSDTGTTGNQVLGNKIGLNAPGNAIIGQLNGVVITNTTGNIIGNGTVNGRNIISGSAYDGILLYGANAANNTVQGNYIGTNPSGVVAMPNLLHGIELREGAHSNQIGGNRLAGQSNLISGNGNHGLVITENAHHNTVQGNFIGPDVTGSYSLGGHPSGGIDIADGSHHNTIGGLGTGQGNVISGNVTDGIALFGVGTTDNQIIGNRIGVNLSNSPLPNIKDSNGQGGQGILNAAGAYRTLILSNTIAYNRSVGILNGGNAQDVIIQDNTITNNAEVGIHNEGASGTLIQGNIIAHHELEGIKETNSNCMQVQITQNTIYSNGGTGINTGNCLIPLTLFAQSTTLVTGTTSPNARVEFFSDDKNEGRVYEGFTTANGLGEFSFSLPGGFTGPNVTATSTDSNNNTSALSQPVHLRWTMLLYFNGDNEGLEEYLEDAFNHIEMAGAAPTANVLILSDGLDSNSYLYDATGGESLDITAVFTSNNELNMGDGDTLIQFVNWARLYYPASYTLLSIVDHGGGWAPGNGIVPTGTLPLNPRMWLAGGSGLSWDFTSEYDFLSSPEIQQAMADIHTTTGPLDVVFYDVCLMGMAEVAYQIKDHVSYFVASQNIGWAPLGPQNRYVQIIQELPPTAVPQEVATMLVDLYAAELPLQGHPFTVSAVDLSEMDTVVNAVNQLGLVLSQTLTTPAQTIPLYAVYSATQKIDYDGNLFIEPEREGFVDLYDFALKLTQQYTDEAIISAAQGVVNAVDTAVLAEAHRSDTPWFATGDQEWNLDDVHGLSIFLPFGEDLEFQIQITETSPISPSIIITRNLRLRDLYSSQELQFVADAPAWPLLIDTYYEIQPTAIVTDSPGGPLPGLQPPDVTPPQTVVTPSTVVDFQKMITITWVATDTQNEVVSATLSYLPPTNPDTDEGWVDTGIIQIDSSGVFTYPLACGRSGFAIRATDEVGNTEPIAETNSIFVEQTCFLFLPHIKRPL